MADYFPNCPYPQPPIHEILNSTPSVQNFMVLLVAELAAKDATIASCQEQLAKKDAQLLEQSQQLEAMTEMLQHLGSRLNTNSTNSNLPPSKDPIGFHRQSKKDPDKPKSSATQQAKSPKESANDGTNKRKARHPGATQPILEPTQTEECRPTVCPHCGGVHFENLEQSSVHQYIELPEFLLRIIHYIVYRGTCSNCGHTCKGEVPQEHAVHYGARLTALIAYIDSLTGTTRRQLQEILRDVLGLPISQGGIQNTIDRTSESIEPHYNVIADGARQSLYNHIDETSWRTHGPILRKLLHWLWVMGNVFIAFFMIARERSGKAFKQLVKEWKGLLISDNYAVYTSWEGKRQSCLAHYMREAKKLAESVNAEEAKCGKRILALLRYLFTIKNGPLPPNFLKNLENRTRRLYEDYGDLKKAKGLVTRLYKDIDTLTLFLRDSLASPTNNFAERLVRTAVCQRKISIGSASEKGERWIERSLSLRKTCALNGVSYYGVLTDAVASHTIKGRPKMYWLRKACAYASQRSALERRAH